MKEVYRKVPPEEFVGRALEVLNVSPETLNIWISPEQLKKDKIESFLIDIYPYYFPCFQKVYFEDGGNILTIVRQLFRQYKMSLERREYNDRGKKRQLYRVRSTIKPLEYSVGFP